MSTQPPVPPVPPVPPLSTDPNNPYGYPPEDIETGKMWAILSYLVFPLFVVPIIQKDNHFALFHAKQSIIIMMAAVVASIATIITCGVGIVLFIPVGVFAVLGLIPAIQGQYKPVPVVGNLAEEWFKSLCVEKKA